MKDFEEDFKTLKEERLQDYRIQENARLYARMQDFEGEHKHFERDCTSAWLLANFLGFSKLKS